MTRLYLLTNVLFSVGHLLCLNVYELVKYFTPFTILRHILSTTPTSVPSRRETFRDESFPEKGKEKSKKGRVKKITNKVEFTNENKESQTMSTHPQANRTQLCEVFVPPQMHRLP